MANKDGIRQVHEFMVVGPDDNGCTRQAGESALEGCPFAGPRSWVVKWFGPFFNTNDLQGRYSLGLYLFYVGNYPLFVSASAGIPGAIRRHVMFSGHRAIPIDLLGREILHYAGMHRQQVCIKTGLLFEDNRFIDPRENLQCYRRAAAAVAYSHSTPCNKYARSAYEYDALTLTNLGKPFPLREKVTVEPKKEDA